MNRQPHIGIFGGKPFYCGRQNIASLHVRGGDHKSAVSGTREFLADPLQVFDFSPQAFRNLHHTFARRGQRREALALTHKHVDAQFAFQFAHLARHAWLRSVQRFRGSREIEFAARDLTHVADLLQVHLRGLKRWACEHRGVYNQQE